jgi:hypothetical protein
MVCEPTSRRVEPDVVIKEGAGVSGAREEVSPFTTTMLPLEARDIVVPEILMAGAPGVTVWEPTTTPVCPFVVVRMPIGVGVGDTAMAVVDPSITRDEDGSRLNVVPPMVTAPPPGVRVWDEPEPPMTMLEDSCEAVRLPIVAMGWEVVLGVVLACGIWELFPGLVAWILVFESAETWVLPGSAAAWLLVLGSTGCVSEVPGSAGAELDVSTGAELVLVSDSTGIGEVEGVGVGVGVAGVGAGVGDARADWGLAVADQTGVDENATKPPPEVKG